MSYCHHQNVFAKKELFVCGGKDTNSLPLTQKVIRVDTSVSALHVRLTSNND